MLKKSKQIEYLGKRCEGKQSVNFAEEGNLDKGRQE